MIPRKESSFPGKLDGDGIRREPLLHHPHQPRGRNGAGPVHFIDHGEAGDAEFVALAPHRLGLGSTPPRPRRDRNRAVENPRNLHLDREIDVGGGVR